MTRPRHIFLLAIAALLVAVVGWQVFSDAEPAYQGKTVSAWLAEAYPWRWAQPPNQCDETDAAVHAIGKQAVPTLLRMLQARDFPFQRALTRLAAQQSWVKIEFTEQEIHQWRAVQGFRILGPEAKEAFPQLRHLFQNPRLAHMAALAMSEVSPDAIPVLRSGLTNQDERIRSAAAWGLRWAKTAAWVGLPQLIQGLQDTSPEVQNGAAWRLGDLRREPDTVLPALLKCAQQDSQVGGRDSSIHAIGCFSNQAVAYVPALLQILAKFQHTNDDLDWEITNALAKIAPSALEKSRARPAAGSPTDLSPVGQAFQPASSGGFPAPSRFGGQEGPSNRQPGKAAPQEATSKRGVDKSLQPR